MHGSGVSVASASCSRRCPPRPQPPRWVLWPSGLHPHWKLGQRMDLARRWAEEIERLMVSSRVCSRPGCGRRVIWRAGHDPFRHFAGVCYVCWGERQRDSAGPNRRSRRAWRRVAQASWCGHCARTVPWAAHWIADGHCVVRQEEFEAERATRRARTAPQGSGSPLRPRETRLPVGPRLSGSSPRPSRQVQAPRASNDAGLTASARALLSSERIARAESLVADGVPQAWRRADRFTSSPADADRVASLILADKTVLVEDGHIILRATGDRLAAIGTEVQAAVVRQARAKKPSSRPRTGPKPFVGRAP